MSDEFEFLCANTHESFQQSDPIIFDGVGQAFSEFPKQ